MGIMQLMPSTAKSLGISNAYDARSNIMGGAKVIAQHLKKYNGDVSLALAAYNAGSGAVDKYGGIPPYTETQNYVKKVLKYYKSA
jgi:soluble lytic murein transglycosylase-like protein